MNIVINTLPSQIFGNFFICPFISHTTIVLNCPDKGLLRLMYLKQYPINLNELSNVLFDKNYNSLFDIINLATRCYKNISWRVIIENDNIETFKTNWLNTARKYDI